MALGSTSEVWVHSDASTGGDTDKSVQGCTHTHTDVHTLQPSLDPHSPEFSSLTPPIYDLTNIMKIFTNIIICK